VETTECPESTYSDRMAENAVDNNEFIADASEADSLLHRDEDETIGCFKRVQRCLQEEVKLLSKCVGSTSPDRSSAVVLFLVLFATSITCLSIRYLMSSEPERFPSYVVTWLIIGFQVATTVCLVLMLCYARTRPAHDHIADAELQPWHRLIRRYIKLFGIVPFYFAIFVFDVFRLIANLTCLDAWAACGNDVVRLEHITDLLYPVARTVCLCVELIICAKFNAADFCQNTLVLVGLAVVQATNLSSWLDALVDESAVFSSERNATYELNRCFDSVTHINITDGDHYTQCFNYKTGEFVLLKGASPYLYPFVIEYLMLVIECVADWFFSDAKRDALTPQPPTMSRPNTDLDRVASPTSGTDTLQLLPTTSYIQPNQQPQQPANKGSRASSSNFILSETGARQGDTVPPTGPDDVFTDRSASVNLSAANECVHIDHDMVPAPDTWCDRCPWFFVSVVLSSIVSFLYVIFGVYNFFLGAIGYLNVFVCYRIGYWLALSFAALVGYADSRRFPSAPMNPNGFEYFVILSCIGPILQCTFTIVANVQTIEFMLPWGMFLAEEISSIVQICVQVVFYAYAKTVRIRSDENTGIDDRELRRKRSILMGIISYYAVCNFALWVEDSFVETRNSDTSWQKHYFEDWPFIYNALNPLSLMFRFNSFLLYLNLLFDKQP